MSLAEKDSLSSNPTDDLDDDVSQFMNKHKIYDRDLHQALLKNTLDMDTLRDVPKEDVSALVEQFGFKTKQKLRFKQLMRKIHEEADDVAKKGKSKGKSRPAARKVGRRRNPELIIADAKMNVLLIGDSASGKTSLMYAYCKDEFFEKLSSSVSVKSSEDYGTYVAELADGRHIEMVVWDTAGQEDYQSVCRQYYRRGDAILFCYDMSKQKPFKKEAYWRKAIEENAKEDVVVVIVGCKYDLAMQHEGDLYEKNKSHAERLRKTEPWKKYRTLQVECSAKTRHNVTEVFSLAAELVAKPRRASKPQTASSVTSTAMVIADKRKAVDLGTLLRPATHDQPQSNGCCS